MNQRNREFRIYFECLEQAKHFLQPKIASALEKSGLGAIPCRLVRRPRDLQGRRNILGLVWFWTTPDILWTYTDGKAEWPLLLVEFSEAVKTEDHELQRSLPALAGFLGWFFVVKISGEKESEREHGGNVLFDPRVVPKVLMEKFKYSGYFYSEWPSADGRLQRDAIYLSCPPGSAFPVLDGMIDALAKAVAATEATSSAERASVIFAIAQKNLRKEAEAYRLFEDGLSRINYDSQSMVGRVVQQLSESGDEEYPFEERVLSIRGYRTYVKINRFDHAADPDRGVLAYLGLISEAPTYAFYQIRRTGKTQRKPELKAAYYRSRSSGEAFVAYGRAEGLQGWFLDAIESKLKRQRGELDITSEAVRQFERWIQNKVSAMLLLSADGLVVEWDRNNARTIIKWDRKAFPIRGIQDSLRYFTVGKNEPLPLREVEVPNEDEVTYVTVHDVLRANGFDLVSVSYPGHQGGFAILRGEEAGRTRSRQYVDIVSIRGGEPCKGAPSLTEAKESLSRGLDQDLAKILRYKREANARNDLMNALRENGFPSDHSKCVLISVAFSAAEGTTIRWRPASVDFLVRLLGRGRWEVAPFGENGALFKKASGATSLPKVYEVVPTG